MSLSPPASHPMTPNRSPDTASLDIRHPTPDLQSLQGAYIGNIERLEEHAERLSSRGSDIGEEIRKLQLEQKVADSRRSSMRSILVDEGRVHNVARSRNASTSSYANSIVDVNGQARWGGYSPGGFITSPVGSIRSGSWSQPSMQRQRSVSRASRLGQVIHPKDDDEEPRHSDRFAVSPTSPTFPAGVLRLSSPKPPSHRSVSSFTRHYDQIAREIHDEFQYTPGGVHSAGVLDQSQDSDGYFPNPQDLPDRPTTAASGDTYHQARTLFHDFDGVHCSPIEEDGREIEGSRQSSLLHSLPAPAQQSQPPPGDSMVFYPAPVPKMLNLPKRLSQLPTASVQAKRRTQLLESMPGDVRKSAIWLSDELRDNADHKAQSSHKRQSLDAQKSLAGLPPQLRASVFFDQVAQGQEIEVKGESAEATLDSILEASAHAPASAFTDHPFAGRVGNEVYGKEQDRKSTATLLEQDRSSARKSRSSLNLLDLRRNSSGDKLNKLQKRNSTHDLNKLTLQSGSRLSLAPGLANEGDQGDEHGDGESEHTTSPKRSFGSIRGPEEEDGRVNGDLVPEEHSIPQIYGPPTTLLAELQMRKQQQKSRNRTAATAFPNGMHSTLLELDAVAEVEKKRRHGQRIALAWEDPEVKAAQDADDDDEDVPLGMLYPGREGLANKKKGENTPTTDWDRPLGLIAQRELEDNEPLSRRRTRLLGVDLTPRDTSPSKRMTSVTPTPSPEPSPSLPLLRGQSASPLLDDGDGETLAQRRQRLKNRETLNAAISEVQTRPVSGEFANEILGQFGASEEIEKPDNVVAVEDEEEETLGQRRARLQAEALARSTIGGNAATRPSLQASHSMADILAAHPVNDAARKVSDELLLSSLPQGSLLQQNEVRRSRHKADMMRQNKRSTSYGLERPLLGDIGKTSSDPALTAQTSAFRGGIYNNGMGGAGAMSTPSLVPPNKMLPPMGIMPGFGFPQQATMPPSMSMNFFPNNIGFPNGIMMSPQTMNVNMNMGMGGIPMAGFQGPGFPQMYGKRQNGMQAMPMPMSMSMGTSLQQPVDPAMDPKQRDMIDRWRQSVMQ